MQQVIDVEEPCLAQMPQAAIVGENTKLIRQAYRKYLTITILVSLSASLGLLINNIIAGNLLGADAVAAVGLSLPIFILFTGLSGMLEAGSVALCAQALGRRDSETVQKYFSVALLCAVIFGVACWVVCFFFNEPIAMALGAKEGVLLQLSADYLKGLSFAAIAIILFQLMMGFVRLDNDPQLGLVAIVVLCICDVGLNVLAVGVLKTGIIGMGIATSIAYFIGVAICCTHFFKKKNSLRFVNPLPHLRAAATILKTGSPNSVARICIMFRTLVFNYLLLMVAGPAAVAGLSIVTSVNAFVSCVSIGIGQTGTLLSGIFFGEEDRMALRATVKTGLRYGLALCAVLCLLVAIFAGFIVSMFGITGGEAYDYGVIGVRAFCLAIPIGLASYLFMNFYTGTGNIKAALATTTAESFLFSTLAALATVWFWGANGVWFAFPLGETMTLIALVLASHFFWRRRLKEHARKAAALKSGDGARPAGVAQPSDAAEGSASLDDAAAQSIHAFPKGAAGFDPAKADALDKIMYLPLGFAADWKASASYSCHNMETVVECSRSIEAFCAEHGIDEKRAYQLSLAIEEMAGNIVEHGFEKTSHPEIEVKVIVKEEGVVLRIRDNGKRFNPLDYDMDGADDFSGIGIKMIRKTMHNIDYRNTVGMNNLVIVL